MVQTFRSSPSNDCRVLHTTILVRLTIIPSAFASPFATSGNQVHKYPSGSPRGETPGKFFAGYIVAIRGVTTINPPLGMRRVAWAVAKVFVNFLASRSDRSLKIYTSNLEATDKWDSLMVVEYATRPHNPLLIHGQHFLMPARVSRRRRLRYSLTHSWPVHACSVRVLLPFCAYHNHDQLARYTRHRKRGASPYPPNAWPKRL